MNRFDLQQGFPLRGAGNRHGTDGFAGVPPGGDGQAISNSKSSSAQMRASSRRLLRRCHPNPAVRQSRAVRTETASAGRRSPTAESKSTEDEGAGGCSRLSPGEIRCCHAVGGMSRGFPGFVASLPGSWPSVAGGWNSSARTRK